MAFRCAGVEVSGRTLSKPDFQKVGFLTYVVSPAFKCFVAHRPEPVLQRQTILKGYSQAKGN